MKLSDQDKWFINNLLLVIDLEKNDVLNGKKNNIDRLEIVKFIIKNTKFQDITDKFLNWCNKHSLVTVIETNDDKNFKTINFRLTKSYFKYQKCFNDFMFVNSLKINLYEDVIYINSVETDGKIVKFKYSILRG